MRAAVILFAALITIDTHAGAPLLNFGIEPEVGEAYASSWLQETPSMGHMHVRVTIKNFQDRESTWTLHSGNQFPGMMGNDLQLAMRITVPAKSMIARDVMVPLEHMGKERARAPSLRLEGPGVKSAFASVSLGGSSRSRPGGMMTEFTVLGQNCATQNAKTWTAPGKAVGSTAIDWIGCVADMPDAPTDWRGYTGIGQLWMLDREWAALSNAQRSALLTWIAHGGLCIVTTLDAQPATLALPEGFAPWAGSVLEHGFGSLRSLTQSEADRSLKSLLDVTSKGWENDLDGTSYRPGEHWLKQVPELKINAPLIFGFIALFALLVGPVNLFVFARGPNRPRLFWTTPLISLGGTALLVGAMLLQDGFGGEGARLSLSLVLPNQKQMITHQEQRAKTGVLLSTGFALPTQEPVWLTPIDGLDTSGAPVRTQHTYQLTDDRADGAWFHSRAVQTLVAARVSSSRGALEVEAKDKALSGIHSLPTALKDVWVRDAQGRFWYAASMATGQRTTFTEKKKDEFGTSFEKNVKPLMRQAFTNDLRRVIDSESAWFIAESEQPTALAIPTLESIRWNDRAFIAGRLPSPR